MLRPSLSSAVEAVPSETHCPLRARDVFSQSALVFFQGVYGRTGVERLDLRAYKGQCVSLVARYVQELFFSGPARFTKVTFGNGHVTAVNVGRFSGLMFEEALRLEESNQMPTPGAVISFAGQGLTSKYGHTAIVVATQRRTGRRFVRVLESNYDNKGPKSQVRLSGWICIDQPDIYGDTLTWSNPHKSYRKSLREACERFIGQAEPNRRTKLRSVNGYLS